MGGWSKLVSEIQSFPWINSEEKQHLCEIKLPFEYGKEICDEG
jgi:hypothetical protein